jgi:uncharacterized membrane protein
MKLRLRCPSSRLLAKAISWEVLATFVTVLIAYPFTRSVCSSLYLAGACLIIKVILFYYHELVWARFK